MNVREARLLWGWVWVPSFVVCTSLLCHSKEGMDWGSCHLTCECFEDSPGVFWKLFFPLPALTIFQAEAVWSFLSHSQTKRSGFVGWEGGESEKKAGVGKGALCRLADWWWSNLSSGIGVNEWHRLAGIWNSKKCDLHVKNCSWLGAVGVHLSRWNTLSLSGHTIPSLALTRREFLYHGSHNKEERERSTEPVGGEVKWGEGCPVRGEEDIVCLWLWATENHELSGHEWQCLEKCVFVWACVNDWTWWTLWKVCVKSVREEPTVCHVGSSRLFKGCSNKAGFFFFLSLPFWMGPAWFLYSWGWAQCCFGVSLVYASFKPPKRPVTRDWLRVCFRRSIMQLDNHVTVNELWLLLLQTYFQMGKYFNKTDIL